MLILVGTALLVVGGLPLLYWLRFDFNPMNLRSPKVELIATYLELKNDPESGANDIQILEPSLAAADEMAGKLRKLPEVARVTTLSTFIPDDQQQKLTLIANAAKSLSAALNPATPAVPPTDAQNVAMINSTLDILNRQIANAKPGAGVDAARRLSDGLTALGKADEATRQRVQAAFVVPLHTALAQLRELFTAHTVTRENLPSDVSAQWVTPSGQARVDVAPKGDANDNGIWRNLPMRFSRSRPTRPRDRFRSSRRGVRSSLRSSRPAPMRLFPSPSCSG